MLWRDECLKKAQELLEGYVHPMIEIKMGATKELHAQEIISQCLKENHTHIGGFVDSTYGGSLYKLYLTGDVPALPAHSDDDYRALMAGLAAELAKQAEETEEQKS